MAEYNEGAYKLARQACIEHSCPFERALLSCCVRCGRSRKINLAEREVIACGDPAVREHFYNRAKRYDGYSGAAFATFQISFACSY